MYIYINRYQLKYIKYIKYKKIYVLNLKYKY